MINWRELPAGLDLDRLIAEKLGDTEIEEREVWVEDIVCGPYQKKYLTCKEHEAIPEFSSDLNAAFRLPISDLYYIALHGPNENDPLWYAFIEWQFHDEYEEFANSRAEAESGALAVCRAWLAWKESHR